MELSKFDYRLVFCLLLLLATLLLYFNDLDLSLAWNLERQRLVLHLLVAPPLQIFDRLLIKFVYGLITSYLLLALQMLSPFELHYLVIDEVDILLSQVELLLVACGMQLRPLSSFKGLDVGHWQDA